MRHTAPRDIPANAVDAVLREYPGISHVRAHQIVQDRATDCARKSARTMPTMPSFTAHARRSLSCF